MARAKRKLIDAPDVQIYAIKVVGKRIALNWWGKAWQEFFPAYSDYDNRLPRARSYVYKGNVQEIWVDGTHVAALVKGSSSQPYRVDVRFEPLLETKIQVLSNLFKDNLLSLENILVGNFPSELAELLTSGTQEQIFPSVEEISYSCTCPDWAVMCKHVASVLYAIASVFDNDPTLFFKLRDFPLDALMEKTIAEHVSEYLSVGAQISERQVQDDEVNLIFGDL